jgi:hypothetical protein
MEITTQFLSLVPLVVALTQLLKTSFKVEARYAAVLALVLGVAGALALGGLSVEAVLQGLVVGLTASGAYSGVKATFLK